MADLNDILVALGRVQASQELMREDFLSEKKAAAESRRILHLKTEALSAELATVKKDLAIGGQITAQVREEVKTLGEKVTQHKNAIQPALNDWQKIKTLGWGASGLFTALGISLGAVFAIGVDTVKTFFVR